MRVLHVWFSRAVSLARRAQGANKKRIGALGRYPTSIACLAFSPGGERLAVAASYTYENGEQPNTPPDAIYVHTLNDALVRPKDWKGGA